jgi:hypothetical protein
MRKVRTVSVNLTLQGEFDKRYSAYDLHPWTPDL